MKVERLELPGCWSYVPQIYQDHRGKFFELFKNEVFIKELGSNFDLRQVNSSFSKRGTLRGIHFTKSPVGQAKYVTCVNGSVLDVLVDLRPNSPTFGKWISVILDSRDNKALYIPAGVGHSFLALEDSIFVYLCDKEYDPKNEFDLDPFDPKLAIEWPAMEDFFLSEKDRNAPSFFEIKSML